MKCCLTCLKWIFYLVIERCDQWYHEPKFSSKEIRDFGRWRVLMAVVPANIKLIPNYLQKQPFPCWFDSECWENFADLIHPKFAVKEMRRDSLLLFLSNCETWHKLSKQPSFNCHFLLLNHLLLHQLKNRKRICLWTVSLYGLNLSTKSFIGAAPLIIRLLRNFRTAPGNRN